MLTVKCPHCETPFTVSLRAEVLPIPEESPDSSTSPYIFTSPPATDSLTSSCNFTISVNAPSQPLVEEPTVSTSPSSPECTAITPSPMRKKEALGLFHHRSGARRSARIRENRAKEFLRGFDSSSSSRGPRRSKRLRKRAYRDLFRDEDGASSSSTSGASSRRDADSTAGDDLAPSESERVCVGRKDTVQEDVEGRESDRHAEPNRSASAVVDRAEVSRSRSFEEDQQEDRIGRPEGVEIHVSSLGADSGWIEHNISAGMRRVLGLSHDSSEHDKYPSRHQRCSREALGFGAVKRERRVVTKDELEIVTNHRSVKNEGCDVALPWGVAAVRHRVKLESTRGLGGSRSVIKHER